MQQAANTPVDAAALLDSLLRALSNWYQSFQTVDGPDRLRREWTRRSSYANAKRVKITAVNEVFEGTTRGLESDGALRVETEAGEIKVVRSADVTLRTIQQHE